MRRAAHIAAAAIALAGGGALVAADPAARFDHAQHAALEPVAIGRCADCHDSGPDGALVPPGKRGHQPCLASGCHVDDFLASGPRVAREDPPRAARAARFCAGCHASATGAAPARASRPAADAVFRGARSRDHHVELDHLAHAARTSCRGCHVVDATSFALVDAAPGHAECAGCHGNKVQPGAKPMAACAECHTQPGGKAYFAKAREGSDVRSCGDATATACFRHERVEHRVDPGGKSMECGSCHFMIADRSKWGKHRYGSLAELKAAPIIHNQRDQAHASCGARGCHAADVDDARGKARCKLCHSSKVVEQSLFD